MATQAWTMAPFLIGVAVRLVSGGIELLDERPRIPPEGGA